MCLSGKYAFCECTFRNFVTDAVKKNTECFAFVTFENVRKTSGTDILQSVSLFSKLGATKWSSGTKKIFCEHKTEVAVKLDDAQIFGHFLTDGVG